jgi:uncharacterized Rmd1/YagE family protein
MRCSSYCTASSYEIDKFVQHLVSNGLDPKHFDDVIHIHKEILRENKTIDIFYFSFGCTVIWGCDENEEKRILDELLDFSLESMKPIYLDFISCKHDPSREKNSIDEERNEIYLKEVSIFDKLSVSYALAQSVKLMALEKSVNELIKQTSPLQKELALTGTVSLSKKKISKQIGFLFNERYSINLHSDILDMPEFFWRKPSYEPLYLMTANFQDIQVRQNILNHRLDMIHELYTLLSNELNYKHSTRLELIIVFLITIEVLTGFVHLLDTKLFQIFH